MTYLFRFAAQSKAGEGEWGGEKVSKQGLLHAHWLPFAGQLYNLGVNQSLHSHIPFSGKLELHALICISSFLWRDSSLWMGK